MRIHCAVAVLVIIASFLLAVSPTELVIIFFSIGLVLVAETANTAFELLLDYINGSKYHSTVKMLKDIAAGGVLIASLNAVIIGLIIFLPKLNSLSVCRFGN